jgi:hypothetical protein
MKAKTGFKNLLAKAALSARRKAARKNLPVAISENGEIKLIYPDKKVKIVRPLHHKKAS